MKKTTIETMISYLNGNNVDVDELRDELTNELTKANEKANRNAALYATAKEAVLAHMSTTPMTCADIYDAAVGDLPAGFSKSKVQYGLLNMWAADVVKHVMPKGAANMYSLPA